MGLPASSEWPARQASLRPAWGGIVGTRLVSAAAVSFSALALAVPLSAATFPRTNGLLVYEAQIGKHYQLFTIKADGSGAQQLTRFVDSDAVWAAWSPSGHQIAFERDVYSGVR